MLKDALHSAYGFADKRFKDINKVSVFVADDRSRGDLGADKQLLSPYCSITVQVTNEDQVQVTLGRNVPVGDAVEKWIKDNQASYNG